MVVRVKYQLKGGAFMDYELLGKRIRDERLLLRLTIEQLAERVDKSTNYIGQIERNDGKPSLETIVDIANALGTTADALLKDSLKTEQRDGTIQEISTLLYSLDDNGKQFILDMVKRYSHYHQPQSGNSPPDLWRLPIGWGSSHRGNYTRAQR